ncbi:hypothetical protein CBR_g49738 [Chara braunii]|uniref:CCHC-type domain-containing protein n=1 Tax=Chara braunii TaxID=69332 RepID=A0A388M5Y1_CHABU|nr:hypothetical protein CBR_g49738 [Chara braunii]|eukprot:GBG89889.1 hypothetical protein CBR_g49738 [Chara braunii]
MAGTEQQDDRGGGDNRRSEDRRDEERRDDDRRRYRAPTCYNCHEPGHYANQCPERNRCRHYIDKPSTSSDSRGGRSPRRRDYRRREDSPPPGSEKMLSTVAELGKSVAAMKDFYDEVKRKEDKAHKKLELKEAEEREKAEQELAERKARKKMEKARREAQLEAERRAELRKDNDIHLPIRLSEMEENFSAKMKCDVKAKKVVELVSDDDEESDYNTEESETSVTLELSEKTYRLCLSEKRKCKDDVKMEDSPPMELPAKRTPRRVGLKPVIPNAQLTQSKSKAKGLYTLIPTKTRTPVKTPLSRLNKSRKTPLSGRLTSARRWHD